jgi:hypothetical protein
MPIGTHDSVELRSTLEVHEFIEPGVRTAPAASQR